MTNPNQPGQVPQWGPPPPAPQKKGNGLKITLIVVSILVGLLFVGCAALVAESDLGGAGKPIGTETTDAGGAAATEAAEDPAPPELTPDDVMLSVKVLDKQCFGSAGCNLTYRVEVDAVTVAVPADASYEVSYEVRGPESGAEIGTLTITGDEYEVPMENFTMTRSSGVKLKAKVTEVAPE